MTIEPTRAQSVAPQEKRKIEAEKKAVEPEIRAEEQKAAPPPEKEALKVA